MGKVRTAAVAGLFYPNDSHVLINNVRKLLNHVDVDEALQPPKVIIAPHAGYIYPGITAAKVYKQLEPLHNIIKRVVCLAQPTVQPLQGLL